MPLTCTNEVRQSLNFETACRLQWPRMDQDAFETWNKCGTSATGGVVMLGPGVALSGLLVLPFD